MEKRRRKPSKPMYEKRQGIDLVFLITVFALVLFGLVMVFSASSASALYKYNDSYYFIKDQAKWAAVGIGLMFVVIYICRPIWFRIAAIPAYLVSMGLLLLVILVGPVINEVQRWFVIGGISFQPSEIAKLSLVLMLALLISSNYRNMGKLFKGILPVLILTGVYCALLIKEPHFSATILVLAIAGVMMLVGGMKIWYVGVVGALGGGGVALVIMNSTYAMNRVKIWLNPFLDPQGLGFQTIQSLYAIGSGGLFGLGLGNSRQKHLYLPEPQNDFIFSIVCEELGYVGALAVLALFGVLIWRGIVIAVRAPDRFTSLVVVGIVAKTAIQAILNIAVATNLVPNTGIPLPFFSAGGTSLVMLLIEMGIVLNISRYCLPREGGQ